MFSLLKNRLVTGLQTKVGIAIIGALVVGGGGTALAMTATHGNLGQLGAALTAPGSSHDASSNTPCGAATEPSGQSGDQDSDHDQCGQGEQHETELEGMVGSVDTGSSSFTVNVAEHGSITVTVDGNTKYGGGLSGLDSLQQGARVRVWGTKQSNGSVLAASVVGGSGEHSESTEAPEPTHAPEGTETPEPTHAPEGTETPGDH